MPKDGRLEVSARYGNVNDISSHRTSMKQWHKWRNYEQEHAQNASPNVMIFVYWNLNNPAQRDRYICIIPRRQLLLEYKLNEGE
eukprot:scaffold660317_cov59-Prasinocladus_malaysianus.AAC.1